MLSTVGVCVLTLYVIWLDQATQGFTAWLVGRSPLSKLFSLDQILAEAWDLAWGDDEPSIPVAYA